MWVFLAFSVAFFDSIRNVIAKHSLKNLNEYVVAWSNCAFSLVFLFPVLFFIPEIKSEFWTALTISGTLNVIALTLYMRSIKLSDISKVIPLTTISPLLLLITSPIIVGEIPGAYGIAGMVLIVMGAYLLNFKNTYKGLFAPFKSLIFEPGPRYMLLVVILWSITANYDKIGVKSSSPLFYSFSIQLFISVFLIFFGIIMKKFHTILIKENIKPLLGLGAASAITIFAYTWAMTLTLVPYVISIKRTNSIMSVILGKVFFKEGNLTERLLAAVLMFIGVLLITFS